MTAPKLRRQPVDLPSAQKALWDLKRILAEHSDMRERTARMLDGTLPCPDAFGAYSQSRVVKRADGRSYTPPDARQARHG